MRTIIATATMILLFGMISEAQLTGVKKGLCVRASGMLTRKIKEGVYTLQLDYSSQTEDIIVETSALPDSALGNHTSGAFLTNGDMIVKFQDLNGKITERNMPIFRFSSQCDKQLKAAGK